MFSETLLQINLFGKFSITYEGQPLTGFDGRKVQELCAFLMLNRGSTFSREQLAEILWEDFPADKARKYLRQTLWQLQSRLEQETMARTRPLLLADAEAICVNPRAVYALDIADFEEHCAAAPGRSGQPLNAAAVERLEAAVMLYSGDLLEGWYQDWCLYERERLNNWYLIALDKLLHYCIVYGAYENGMRYADKILRCDRTRERTHRSLMRLHYLAGDRTTAIRQYERCVAILHKELGVKPARQTTHLYEQICADTLEPADSLGWNLGKSPQVNDLLRVVHQMQRTVAETYSHVRIFMPVDS